MRKFSAHQQSLWRQSIFAIYSRMRAKSLSGPYEAHCGDLTLTVLPNVYAPRFFTDSLWFADRLPSIVKEGSLLEIGTGTGIISIACAISGAKVVATDLNPDAVRNTHINSNRYHRDISVRWGDLYDPILSEEKFDFIFWAHPFNNWETPVEDELLRSGMDYRYEAVRGYIGGARHHLTTKGRLLLGTADSADLETICEISYENGYEIRILDRVELPFEEGGVEQVTYLLCELVT